MGKNKDMGNSFGLIIQFMRVNSLIIIYRVMGLIIGRIAGNTLGIGKKLQIM